VYYLVPKQAGRFVANNWVTSAAYDDCFVDLRRAGRSGILLTPEIGAKPQAIT
jgi:hypothetical protein